MEFYLDELVLLNGTLDYLMLLAAGRLARAPLSRLRLAAASLLGAAGAVGNLLAALPAAAGLAAKTALSALMVLIAFGRRGYGRTCLLFYLVSFLFGGGVWALSLALPGRVRTVGGAVWTELSLPALLACGAALYLFSARAAGRRCDLSGRGGRLRTVRCERGGHSAAFIACTDTGCALRDPVSNTPVILAEMRAVRPLLSPDAVRVLQSAAWEGAGALAALPPAERTAFRLVPCRTAAGSGLLPAFRPDRISVDGRALSALVAVSPTELRDIGASALMGEIE